MIKGYITTATNKLRRLNIYCCVTCGEEKDSFSKEWEYAQCQTCSMKEVDNG